MVPSSNKSPSRGAPIGPSEPSEIPPDDIVGASKVGGKSVPCDIRFAEGDQIAFAPSARRTNYWAILSISLAAVTIAACSEIGGGSGASYPETSEILAEEYQQLCAPSRYDTNCRGRYIDWEGIYRTGLGRNSQVDAGVVTFDVSDEPITGLNERQFVRVQGYLGEEGLVYPDLENVTLTPLETEKEFASRRNQEKSDFEREAACVEYLGGGLDAIAECGDSYEN